VDAPAKRALEGKGFRIGANRTILGENEPIIGGISSILDGN